MEPGRICSPLPPHIEKVYSDTLGQIRGIAARIKETRKATEVPVTGNVFDQLTGNNRNPNTLPVGGDGQSRRITTEMIVPAHRAGLVIGQGGETLRRFEKASQCRLQFDQHYTGPENERRVIITGLPEDVEEAKRLIKEKVQGYGSGAPPSYNPHHGMPSVQINIPSGRVGLVIGRGGETIRDLQERTGAKVVIAQDNNSGTSERAVTIIGSEEAVARAKQMVLDIVDTARGGFTGTAAAGLYGSGPGAAFGAGPGTKNALPISIPEHCVGAVIGKRAETLKQIQSMSGARIFIEPQPAPGAQFRVIHLSGPTPEAVAYAQALVNERVVLQEAALNGQPLPGAGQLYYPGGAMPTMMMDPQQMMSMMQQQSYPYDYATLQQQQQPFDHSSLQQQQQQSFDYSALQQQQQSFDYNAANAQYTPEMYAAYYQQQMSMMAGGAYQPPPPPPESQ